MTGKIGRGNIRDCLSVDADDLQGQYGTCKSRTSPHTFRLSRLSCEGCTGAMSGFAHGRWVSVKKMMSAGRFSLSLSPNLKIKWGNREVTPPANQKPLDKSPAGAVDFIDFETTGRFLPSAIHLR